MQLRRRQAFTILELLTVVAILAMLMAMLFPTLSASRRKAKANACLSRLKGLGTGAQVYLTENRDYFFPFRMKKLSPDSIEDYVNHYNRLAPRWHWFLELDLGPVIDPKPFARLRQAFDDEGLFMGTGIGRRMTIDAYSCPSLRDADFSHDVRNGAYGYNYQYLGNTRTDTDPTRWDNFAVGMHQIKCVAKTVLFADSRGASTKHGKHSYTLDPPRLATEANAVNFGPDAHDVWLNAAGRDHLAYSPAEARHDDLANVAFTDGHAEPKTLLELGYQLNRLPHLAGHPDIAELPPKTAIPLLDPTSGPYEANNSLWNGLCRDPIAEEANNPTVGEED